VQVGFRKLVAYGLIDSGAEVSFLPRFLAKELGCIPPSYDVTARTGVDEFPAGDVMARVHLLLAKSILSLSPAPFMVPAPGFELPFVILGHDPLFEKSEIRFRGWEARIGFRPRPPPWMERGPAPTASPPTG
jgi:hypothetical protein